MSKSPVKTALEATVEQHGRELENINETMKAMVSGMQGLRDDMSERGERMISMINMQNTILTKNLTDNQATITKNQTDHEAADIQRFADIKTQMAYYLGYAVGSGAIIALCVSIAAIYFGRSHG